jgi:hypothetical protein
MSSNPTLGDRRDSRESEVVRQIGVAVLFECF